MDVVGDVELCRPTKSLVQNESPKPISVHIQVGINLVESSGDSRDGRRWEGGSTRKNAVIQSNTGRHAD